LCFLLLFSCFLKYLTTVLGKSSRLIFHVGQLPKKSHRTHGFCSAAFWEDKLQAVPFGFPLGHSGPLVAKVRRAVLVKNNRQLL